MFKFDGKDVVVNQRGDVMAQKVYGQWETKDAGVLEWIESQQAKPVAEKPKKKFSLKKKAE
tara:strand:+ start:801 stop:983 length:183 start_codon:yes stop_codon:yes gene_type:complete